MALADKFHSILRDSLPTSSDRCNQWNLKEAEICVLDKKKQRNKKQTPAGQRKMSVVQVVPEDTDSFGEIQPNIHASELQEEHKRLLVKAVAEKVLRGMPEDEIWEEIARETGFDHRIVWKEMRDIATKKLKCLLPANDLLENISTMMQMTATDWLLFNLVLVHENINVVNPDSQEYPEKSSKHEPDCLQELFDLVKEHRVEDLVGEALIEAWKSVTFQYNSRGRQCSPMLLQLRWYQLKQLTRDCFYNSYDGKNSVQSAIVVKPTVLQIAIAVAYNKIITQQHYPSWETLIKLRRVILHTEFDSSSSKTKPCQNETISTQLPETLNEPPVLLLLDGSHTAMDGHMNNAGKDPLIVTDDVIIIDLKNDKEYVDALQNTMAKAGETTSSEKEELELKERLVRDVVRMSREKPPDKSLWDALKMETGRDCLKLWNDMRDVAMEKVKSLLEANDLVKNVAKAMQLSPTDWLFLDFVLVQKYMILLNREQLEYQCLQDLFALVQKYNVENLSGDELAEAWISITLQYNRLGRQCSPMVLQLRWYQLKVLARDQVYKTSSVVSQWTHRMLCAIATKYQRIITQPLLNWKKLITKKLVILPDGFVTIIKRKAKWKEVEAQEGWYLYINKEISKSDNEIITVNDGIESNLAESNPKVNKFLEQKTKNAGIIPNHLPDSGKDGKMEVSEIIDLDSDDEINEILREKADNLMNMSQKRLNCDPKSKSTVSKKSKNSSVMLQAKPLIGNIEPISCDSDEEMDKLLKEKADLMSMKFPENLKPLENIKIKAVEIVNEMVKSKNHYEELDEVDFDDNNIEFVDDGIEFEEGNDDNTEKVKARTGSSHRENDNDAEECADNFEIDLKLLMNTTVYTKKIDCMEIFKFIDYNYVADKRVIERVEAESKPLDKRAPKDEDIAFFRDQALLKHKKDDDVLTRLENTQHKVKSTSWLLQKPKKRKYETSQLSKNPDFNIQLKKLTKGFLSSTRNRGLLKECQPITIDVHKAFENKLIDGTLYLNRGNFKTATPWEIRNKNNYKNTPPSMSDVILKDRQMLLAGHVRDLIETMISDDRDEDDLQVTRDTLKLPVKRNRVVHLPDKDQIRLTNQSLLTAEITPRHQAFLNVSTTNGNKNKESVEPSKTICIPDSSPNKRFKSDLNTFELASSPQKLTFCCWAREKIINAELDLDMDLSNHSCIENYCNCCCRLDLLISLTSKLPYNETSSVRSETSDNVVTNNIIMNNKAMFRVKHNYSEKDSAAVLPGICSIVSNKKPPHYTINTKTSMLNYDNCTKTKTHPTVVKPPTSQGHQAGNLNNIPNQNTSNLIYYAIDTNTSQLKKDKNCTNTKDSQTELNASNSLFDFRSILPKTFLSNIDETCTNKIMNEAVVTTPKSLLYNVSNLNSTKVTKDPKNLLPSVKDEISTKIKIRQATINRTTSQQHKSGTINIASNQNAQKILNYPLENNSMVPKDKILDTKARLTVVKASKSDQRAVRNNTIIPWKRNDSQPLPISIPQNVESTAPLPSSQKVDGYVILPTGVNFIKLAGEGLALSINPGVEVSPEQLHSLMSVCAAVNSNQSQPSAQHHANSIPDS